jgi:hypothetical protein
VAEHRVDGDTDQLPSAPKRSVSAEPQNAAPEQGLASRPLRRDKRTAVSMAANSLARSLKAMISVCAPARASAAAAAGGSGASSGTFS